MFYKKILVLFLMFFAMLSLVKGSCLEYGHSCWGAHGKRSGDNSLKGETGFENNQDSVEVDDILANEKLKFKNKIEGLSGNTKEENSDNYYPNNGDYKGQEQIPKFLKEALKLHKTQFNENQNNNMKTKNRKARPSLLWRKLPLYQYPAISLKDNEWVQQLEGRATPNGLYDDTVYYDGQ